MISVAFAIRYWWPVYVAARGFVIQTWNDLPGPWWVKALLIAACLAIPGPADEIALLAITRACRAWRARTSPTS